MSVGIAERSAAVDPARPHGHDDDPGTEGLVRHGPEAVSDRPTAKMHRAKELVENWSRWGTVRNDALGRERRLASNKHDLKTRLEDARNETPAWRQVYRAMKLVADWSEGSVHLQEGGRDEGKYVLVHQMEDEP